MSGKKEEAKETPQQRAMVDLALNQVADYKKRWLPIQMNLAESVDKMGADDSFERRQAKGIASTETEAKFSRARDRLEGSLANRGVAGSSKAKLAIAGLGEDQAASTGMGISQAEQQIDDAYTSGLGTIMQLGQGQKSSAMQGVVRSAGLSGQRAAADAQASLQHRMGNAQLVGKVAGAGLAMYGAAPAGVTGTNDLQGVNGSNAMDQWTRYGVGGD